MKKSFFVLTLVLICCSVSSIAQEVEINVKNLSKKWKLEKYTYWGFTEKPSTKEQNDFLFLHLNKTFSSISEGRFDKGNWELDDENQCLKISNANNEMLTLSIEVLESQKLVVFILGPDDQEAKYLKIHFKN